MSEEKNVIKKIDLEQERYVTLEFDNGKIHISLEEGGVNVNVNFDSGRVVWKTNASNSITAIRI